ncbi:hypothetical protein [Corynebacterium urogenitale]|uniref:hypothetical protein n=1 Tax=Corynebacterium urogenitale TaxID=2487892 RepID=UPI001375AFD2|nr:hypothetical protein [Corynebacterium urogenitale]
MISRAVLRATFFSDSDARVWLGIAGAVGAIGIVAGLLSPQVRAQVSKFFGGRR